MNYFQSPVIQNRQISEDIFVLEVERRGASAAAGQFYMIKCWNQELTLMRPISIFKADDHSLHFMYRVIGQGTRLMANLHEGDEVSLLGALGNGFPVKEMQGRLALIGGGLGIPPLCQTAKELTLQQVSVDLYLGYRDTIFSIEDFEPYANKIFISTESGSEGYKGFITDLLHPEDYDAVFTCGPLPMMQKVSELCTLHHTPTWCSMEHRMACGIGACLGCSILTTKGMKRVCKEGPVFPAQILFDQSPKSRLA